MPVAVGDRLLLLQRGELLADRSIGRGESVEDLRSFYFQRTGEIDEDAGLIARVGE